MARLGSGCPVCNRKLFNSRFDATFRLDDMDYSCLALDDLHDSVATLLAEWSGRLRPTNHTEEPAHIVQAAIEWRNERARRFRR